MTLTVPTPDGRSLEVLVSGPDDGFPLVSHHGTPQGAVHDGLMESAATPRGLRLIQYSRPGYGASTPRSDGATTGTVADDAADTATILDHLGLGEFVTIGWSGGGPRALACAAMLPGRCLAAVSGVGLVPPDEYDAELTAGMGEENIAEFGAAFEGPEALTKLLEAFSPDVFAATAADVADSLGSLAPPVDRAALTGETAEWIAATFRRAGAQGVVGWRDDDLTMIRPWGFSVRHITVPVSVWQGTLDMMVPFTHAEWLAANVPGARLHLVEGEGHISLTTRMPEILDDLLTLAGRS
ncbi:MAG: alpha/beta hydrolase [Nocardioidaceae bacterium]